MQVGHKRAEEAEEVLDGVFSPRFCCPPAVEFYICKFYGPVLNPLQICQLMLMEKIKRVKFMFTWNEPRGTSSFTILKLHMFCRPLSCPTENSAQWRVFYLLSVLLTSHRCK